MNLNKQLASANIRLKNALVGVSIAQRTNRLYLRATLPPKPNSLQTQPHQQWLSLGIYANKDGIKRALSEAQKLGGLIACKEFSWDNYLKVIDNTFPTNTEHWISEFEKRYFETRQRNNQTETTWKIDYLSVFKKLPQLEILTRESILKVVLTTKADTKTRKRTCTALTALVSFAQLDIDLKPYAGRYNPKKVSPRDLPSDDKIAETYYQIDNPAWQWVYGMMATYGLRNHEVFRIDFADILNSTYIITVGKNSKTGLRRIWACYPEWVKEFNLQEVILPEVNLNRPNADVGHAVTNWFYRHLSFQPYDLRHAWAIRTLEFGLDISLAAQQMGHSTQVHSELYHHWISERHHQRAFDLAMYRAERPQPPVVPFRASKKNCLTPDGI